MNPPRVTIDASVAVRWVLEDEADRGGVLELQRSLESGAVAGIEPAHFLLEVAGALDRAVRDRRINRPLARRALSALEALGLDDAPQAEVARDAFDIAGDTGLRVADAAYLVCAARNRAQLVSADRRQLEAAASHGIPAVALDALPTR